MNCDAVQSVKWLPVVEKLAYFKLQGTIRQHGVIDQMDTIQTLYGPISVQIHCVTFPPQSQSPCLQLFTSKDKNVSSTIRRCVYDPSPNKPHTQRLLFIMIINRTVPSTILSPRSNLASRDTLTHVQSSVSVFKWGYRP